MTKQQKQNDLYRSPVTYKELQDYVNQLQGIDRTVAVAVMAMTWNLATRLFNKALKNNKSSIDEDLFECERCLGIFDIEDSIREHRKGPLICGTCSEPNWLDIEDASKLLGIRSGTIYRWVIDAAKYDIGVKASPHGNKYLININSIPPKLVRSERKI